MSAHWLLLMLRKLFTCRVPRLATGIARGARVDTPLLTKAACLLESAIVIMTCSAKVKKESLDRSKSGG